MPDMNNTNRTVIAIICITTILLFCALPAASAAGAQEVVLNGVTLSTAAPYWKNDNTTYAVEPPEWNAYFDAAAATLTLQDAVVDTPADTASSHSQYNLIYADGDLALRLSGASTISFDGTNEHGIFAVSSDGFLTVSGEGSVVVNIRNSDPSAVNAGLFVDTEFICTGGSLTMDIQGEDFVLGVASHEFLHAGGTLDISVTGVGGYAVLSQGSVRFTGGSATIHIISTGEYVYALTGSRIYLEGGEGRFISSGSGFGAMIAKDVLQASGGHFVLAGDASALTSYSISRVVINGVNAYVSEQFSGEGRYLWMSVAPGEEKESDSRVEAWPYRYMEFEALAMQAPRTGDESHPWLWAGSALFLLVGVAGMLMTMRKRRTRRRA